MSTMTEREMLDKCIGSLEHLRDDIIIRSQMQDDYVDGEVMVGFSAWEGLLGTIEHLKSTRTSSKNRKEHER